MTDQYERITDEDELAQVRRQARQVNLKSLIVGIVLTALVIALPF